MLTVGSTVVFVIPVREINSPIDTVCPPISAELDRRRVRRDSIATSRRIESNGGASLLQIALRAFHSFFTASHALFYDRDVSIFEVGQARQSATGALSTPPPPRGNSTPRLVSLKSCTYPPDGNTCVRSPETRVTRTRAGKVLYRLPRAQWLPGFVYLSPAGSFSSETRFALWESSRSQRFSSRWRLYPSISCGFGVPRAPVEPGIPGIGRCKTEAGPYCALAQVGGCPLGRNELPKEMCNLSLTAIPRLRLSEAKNDTYICGLIRSLIGS